MEARRMASEGDRVPDVTVHLLDGGTPRAVRSGSLFAARRVVAFALPGAFTPTCSAQHLPRYEDLVPTFREHGVDAVLCLAVNDPFVMSEWGRTQGVQAVQLVSDGNGDFAEAMGLLVDQRELGFGRRSRRYSMCVRDGRIETLCVEPDEPGDPYGVSDADTMLHRLAPAARSPSHVAIVTKPGCPHCAHAKEALRRHGLPYVELAFDDAQRGRVLGALANARTVPQVFVDGRLVGGADALDAWLAGRDARD